jgi:hypothetical protein
MPESVNFRGHKINYIENNNFTDEEKKENFQTNDERKNAKKEYKKTGPYAYTTSEDNATLHNTNMNNPKYDRQYGNEFRGGKTKKTKTQKQTKTNKNKQKQTKHKKYKNKKTNKKYK